MIYKRATTFEDLRAIEGFLVLEADEPVELFMANLVAAYRTAPEQVACFQAWDNGELKAFILAQLEGPNSVWISQGWSDSANPWEVASELVNRVKLWAVALGRTKVQARTKRSARAMYERFGFEEVARVMEIRIDQQTQESVFASLRGQANE